MVGFTLICLRSHSPPRRVPSSIAEAVKSAVPRFIVLSEAQLRRIRRSVIVVIGLGLLLCCHAAGAEQNEAVNPPLRTWSSDLLRDPVHWPHAARDSRIVAGPTGLRVEVVAKRRFAIAATSGLGLPRDLGRIRVRVAETGGEATWFLRLYGELRERGKRRTVGIAQDEPTAGDYVFPIDPRLRQRPEAPVQLQLGVEGPPGAFVIFQDVAFLPAVSRPNRRIRQFFQPGQKDIAAVERMPNLPEPLELIDWREKARAYDRFVFDLRAEGQFLPLVWLDESHINVDRTTFGMPSYVGDPHRSPRHTGAQEGITCMGAVLGATLVGIDKRRAEHDYVGMCEAWFNSRNGLNLVLNLQQQETGGSFWYEIWPQIVFCALADRYPDNRRLTEIMRVTADRWRGACRDLAGPNGVPDFDHTSYNFRTRQPVDNGRWKEPDAAAGVAWLQYAAWVRFRDPQHLAAAEDCLRFLQGRSENPYYEVLLPYGTLVAARLNAELKRDYDVDRLLDWCFGISDCRGGWGVTLGRWGDYDCDGLVGSIDNRVGYAFAMNTFAQAGALVPLARYDTRYARAIGKWILNLANSARLFYPGALPPDHQTCRFWRGDPEHVVAYEGLRYRWQGKSPCATGDPVAMHWGPKTDLGLYGSGYVGVLGGIVRTTNVPGILQLDCLATDFFRGEGYPTFLCYNPYPEERSFRLAVGAERADLYDAVTHRIAMRNVCDRADFALPADSAAVIVVVPPGGTMTRRGKRTLIDGVVIDWQSGPD